MYVGHFKCKLRRIADYPNLSGYLRDLYQIPGIAETVNFDHIKRHYYMTHAEINPTAIVPIGPAQAPLGASRTGIPIRRVQALESSLLAGHQHVPGRC